MRLNSHILSLNLGQIELGKAFFLRLENAFLLAKNGDIIEVLSDFDNLESDLVAWCHFKGEIFVEKKPLKHAFSYYLRKNSQENFTPTPLNVENLAPTMLGLAPRGASVQQGSPKYHFNLSSKENVWSDSLIKLYEEAKKAQWNATRDIAWNEIPSYEQAYEQALAQIMTYLIENEFLALYIPSQFLAQISPFYTEVPLFLASIIGDEARHIEAFLKRAKATKLGVQHSSVATQRSLYTLFNEKDYFKSSFLLHIMGEGTFIDLLAFLEEYAKDEPTKRLLYLARLDEARHVAYGQEHIKGSIKSNPHKVELLKECVFSRRHSLDEINAESSLLIEALSVFAGGSTEPNAYKKGFEMVENLKAKMHINRTQRLVNCGIDEDLAVDLSKAHTPNFM